MPRQLDEAATNALINLYQKTYNDILKDMTSAVDANQFGKVQTLANLNAQLKELGVKTDKWVNTELTRTYNDGRKIAVQGLKNLYEVPVYHGSGGANGRALLGNGYYVSFDKNIAKMFGDGKVQKSYLAVYDPNKAYVVRSQEDIDKVFKRAVKAFPKLDPQEAMKRWYSKNGYDIVIAKNDPETGILVVNKSVLSSTPLTVDDGFSIPSQKMLKALVNSTTQSFGQSLSGVGRSARNVFTNQLQEQIKQQIASKFITSTTQVDITNTVKQTLLNEGLTAVKDSAGRSWSLDRYAEMLSRTQLTEARNNGLMTQMMENGQDLVQVSINGSDHPECAVWEGEILSLTGETAGFATIDEAEGSDLFHPNCMHTIDPIDTTIAELTDGWNSETGQYEEGMFEQDNYAKITLDKTTKQAVDDGVMPRFLALQGYSVDEDMNILDPKGKQLTEGAFQKLTQSSSLTQKENIINRGGQAYRKLTND